MSKEVLPKGTKAKLDGWRKICRKYAELELYGYNTETGTYEDGCIAKEFETMLICIENILMKLNK